MNKRIFAICDKDNDYLEMLQSYLLKKNPADFEILAFNSLSRAKEASKTEGFEIFLIAESIYDKDVINVAAQKTFVLQEDGTSGITEYSIVQKYQSTEKLISQVLDEFALDDNCQSVKNVGKTQTKLICFYSPERHKGQSIAAFCGSQVLADMGKKVLYISMQPFSGFEELLKIKYESDITDFMYFVPEHSDKLFYKLEGIKNTIHGVDYLPPALDYMDLLHIDEVEWKTVTDMLLYSTDYDYIAIDLTETCKGFYYMLEKSGKVYILRGNDLFSNAALAQFQGLLKAKGMNEIFDKSVYFNLVNNWEQHISDLSRLSFSPIGAHMKGLLA